MIDGGDNISVALSSAGKVFTWGTFRDENGKLAFNHCLQVASRPQQTPFSRPIIKIAAGANHVLALDERGRVYSWGLSDSGRLGRVFGTRRDPSIAALTPSVVGIRDPSNPRKLLKATEIGAGAYHSFAVTECGRVFSWGLNNYGQLGLGNTETAVCPTEISSLYSTVDPIKKICGGEHHSVRHTVLWLLSHI